MDRRTLPSFCLVALGSFGCDQVSKGLARAHLESASVISLLEGVIELRRVENPGAFLSLGADLPPELRAVALQLVVPVLLLAFCVALLLRSTPREAVGLALVLGGGAGNWLDRVLGEGTVTDFVRMGVGRVQTGIFNMADVAIVLGAAILLLEANTVLGRRRREGADAGSRPGGAP
jgi:signal peptidase II